VCDGTQAFGHDPDDVDLLAAETHSPSDDHRIAAESSLPYVVADDDDRWSTGPFVRIHERSAEERRNAGQPECRGANQRHLDRLGAAVSDDEILLDGAERAEVLNRFQLRAPRDNVVRCSTLLLGD
jgi:hypothetical protein